MSNAAAKSFLSQITNGNDRLWEIEVPCAQGRRAFYKLAVHPLKEAAFRRAWEDGMTVDISKYGDVVEVGYIIPANDQKIQESA